ncbi:MAG: TonB family protein [Spirochaetales bacterium]|nr:TonB family protein [Spirochaetales bacterium]
MKIAVGVSLLFHGLLLAALAFHMVSITVPEAFSSPLVVSLVSPSPVRMAQAITREDKPPEPDRPIPVAEPVPDGMSPPQDDPFALSTNEENLSNESSHSEAPPESGLVPEPVIAPSLVSELTVVYPYKARKKGYEGQVLCHVRVGTDGKVLDATVFTSSGYDLLDQAALDAVLAAEYSPGTREDYVEVNVIFQLS